MSHQTNTEGYLVAYTVAMILAVLAGYVIGGML
jgi:hypothetical protein